MKNSAIIKRDLAALYALASAPFISDEFDDSNEADLEFLRLLKLVRRKGVKFKGLSFFEDNCPICVHEMKRSVYEQLVPEFEATPSAALN